MFQLEEVNLLKFYATGYHFVVNGVSMWGDSILGSSGFEIQCVLRKGVYFFTALGTESDNPNLWTGFSQYWTDQRWRSTLSRYPARRSWTTIHPSSLKQRPVDFAAVFKDFLYFRQKYSQIIWAGLLCHFWLHELSAIAWRVKLFYPFRHFLLYGHQHKHKTQKHNDQKS